MKVKRVKMWRINRLPNITQQTMGRWHILHSDVFSAIWKPTEKNEKTEKIENGGGGRIVISGCPTKKKPHQPND